MWPRTGCSTTPAFLPRISATPFSVASPTACRSSIASRPSSPARPAAWKTFPWRRSSSPASPFARQSRNNSRLAVYRAELRAANCELRLSTIDFRVPSPFRHLHHVVREPGGLRHHHPAAAVLRPDVRRLADGDRAAVRVVLPQPAGRLARPRRDVGPVGAPPDISPRTGEATDRK